ncbi:MAG TPA: PKD domain-containing protein [Candidatus Brocadiia bacterium]|nr:PKD domain-containing protein [Candidatus Brocadiia bacterium]
MPTKLTQLRRRCRFLTVSAGNIESLERRLLLDAIAPVDEPIALSLPPDGAIDSPLTGTGIVQGDPLTLSGSGSDPDGTVASWNWEISGPGDYSKTFSVEDPGVVYLVEPGDYTITLTVTDDSGDADPSPATANVTVSRAAGSDPNGIIESPLNGAFVKTGESINLQGTGYDPDGSILTWAWTVTGPDAFLRVFTSEDPGSLTLTNPGNYTILLAVVDNTFRPDPSPATVTITVGDSQPPNGEITSPTDGLITAPYSYVNFQGSSSDPDGTVASWLWTITGPFGFNRTFTQEDPGFVRLNSTGVYTATFTVTDDEGISDPTPAVVNVNVMRPGVEPPDGVIDSPADGTVIMQGAPVDLQGSASDPDGLVVAWKWDVTGPDGFSQTFTTEDPGIQYFITPGDYEIKFTVTDDDGVADITPDIVNLTVESSGGTSPNGIIISPLDGTTIKAGQTINLQGTGYDPDGEIMTWAWVIRGPNDFFRFFDAEDPGVITLVDPGTYQVILEVIDNTFRPDPSPAIVNVEVEPVFPPEGIIDSPGSGTVIFPGDSINLMGSGIDSDGWIASWNWVITGPGGFFKTYTVEDPGMLVLEEEGAYLVSLAVTDNDGVPDPEPDSAVVFVGEEFQGNKPPSSQIDSPLPNTEIPVGGTIFLLGSGTDEDGEVEEYRWTVFGPGGFYKLYEEEDPGAVQLTSPGYYNVSLVVVDDEGTPDSSPNYVVVQVGASGNQLPESVINTPTDGLTVRVGDTINLTGTGSDPDGIIAYNVWVVYGPNKFLTGFEVEDPGIVTLEYPGTYTIAYSAIDSSLQPDPTPAYVNVTAIGLPPNGTIDSPIDGLEIRPGDSIELKGTATDPDGYVAKYEWWIGGPDGFEWGSAQQDPGWLKLNNVGDYWIYFTAIDDVGLKDPTPDIIKVTVKPDLVGFVPTKTGGVYIYDADGPSGIPIDGTYGAGYSPYDLSNDLLIIETPTGVGIIARAWVNKSGTWTWGDFSGLGIAVHGGTLDFFIDQRKGTGEIAFLAATEKIGPVVINSSIAGFEGQLNLPSEAGWSIPAGAALYSANGGISSVYVKGADVTARSVTGHIIGWSLGSLITAGDMQGDIRVSGNAGSVIIGYGSHWTGDFQGTLDVGSLNLLYTTGDFNGNLYVDGNAATVYSAGNFAGQVGVGGNISLLYAKKIIGSDTTEITATGIYRIIAGTGFEAELDADWLNSLTVLQGNLSGAIQVGQNLQLLSLGSGSFLADVTVGGDLWTVSMPGGTYRGEISVDGKMISFVAGRSAGTLGDRAQIVANGGISSLVILKDMLDTDVGVGVRSLPSGTTVALSSLYIGGDFKSSNVLAGVWNEPGFGASPFNPFSDGFENGTPYIPAGFAGTARLDRVFIGGEVGTAGAGDSYWAIASKNSPRSAWTLLKTPYPDVIVRTVG